MIQYKENNNHISSFQTVSVSGHCVTNTTPSQQYTTVSVHCLCLCVSDGGDQLILTSLCCASLRVEGRLCPDPLWGLGSVVIPSPHSGAQATGTAASKGKPFLLQAQKHRKEYLMLLETEASTWPSVTPAHIPLTDKSHSEPTVGELGKCTLCL